MADDRPTDDAILEQQNAIRAAEASKIPFVGDKEPLSSLIAEYANGNQVFVDKIKALSSKFSGIRRARGDGNCFFRSFLFAYLEWLAQAERSEASAEGAALRQSMDECKRRLVDLGYAELTWEDFANVLSEQLDIALDSNSDNSTRVQRLVENIRDPDVSNYAVMFLRFVTSCAIQTNQEFFEPFISGTTGLDVVQFCRSMVEPMGEESDHIHITALTNALNVPISIVYLDRSEGGEASIHDFQPDSCAVKKGSHVVLLYRPGHYDVVYVK